VLVILLSFAEDFDESLVLGFQSCHYYLK
jgi:hypothetical protein